MAKSACPICRKKAAKEYQPFCSDHCRNLDLANWLDGRYAVPVQESEPDEDEETQIH